MRIDLYPVGRKRQSRVVRLLPSRDYTTSHFLVPAILVTAFRTWLKAFVMCSHVLSEGERLAMKRSQLRTSFDWELKRFKEHFYWVDFKDSVCYLKAFLGPNFIVWIRDLQLILAFDWFFRSASHSWVYINSIPFQAWACRSKWKQNLRF